MPRDGRTLPHNILEEMRFRAIEAYQAGKGVAEIAKLLGVHWGSVSRWLTKWRRDGERALKERKATGRPPKLDCKRHGKAILELVKHPATEFGYEHPLWTCERIRQVISAELNLAVSVPTLWRELKKLSSVVKSLNGVRWNKILKRVLDGSRPNGLGSSVWPGGSALCSSSKTSRWFD